MKSSTIFTSGFHILVIILAVLFASVGEARERDRELRRGRGSRRGNERSERVARLNVGNAAHAGNGCPAGTMSVTFAPDNLSFSILFDNFVAEAGRAQKHDDMICAIVIPIEIPKGVQMEITRVDYRGFVGLPEASRGVIRSVVNFRGRGGDRDRLTLHYQFLGPLMDNYELSTDTLDDDGPRDQTELSPCGGSAQLRIRNELKLVSRGGESASMTLDSVDGSSNAIYYVNWRQCRD